MQQIKSERENVGAHLQAPAYKEVCSRRRAESSAKVKLAGPAHSHSIDGSDGFFIRSSFFGTTCKSASSSRKTAGSVPLVSARGVLAISREIEAGNGDGRVTNTKGNKVGIRGQTPFGYSGAAAIDTGIRFGLSVSNAVVVKAEPDLTVKRTGEPGHLTCTGPLFGDRGPFALEAEHSAVHFTVSTEESKVSCFTNMLTIGATKVYTVGWAQS